VTHDSYYRSCVSHYPVHFGHYDTVHSWDASDTDLSGYPANPKARYPVRPDLGYPAFNIRYPASQIGIRPDFGYHRKKIIPAGYPVHL
jgi:hypothetical protein